MREGVGTIDRHTGYRPVGGREEGGGGHRHSQAHRISACGRERGGREEEEGRDGRYTNMCYVFRTEKTEKNM
jgi:hypothetical protein